jgi:hypothetical protein
MCHRRPYGNWNVVNVTGHEGVYQMPISSWMSNLGNMADHGGYNMYTYVSAIL